jgi:LPS-assembly protein
VRDARFTNCRACQPEPEIPDVEFRAGEATVFQNDMITARDTSLWVKGIPTLYSPVLALPIGERRTGFLIPRLSYSGHNGFGFRLPFFWAIDRSQDATITPIYRTKRGFELDAEYRYILDERSRGAFNGHYYYDLLSGSAPPNRGDANWIHDQVLSPTWTLKVNANYQTDRTVNRAFIDNPTAQRTQATVDSIAFVSQTTSQYLLTGLVAASEDLSGLSSNWLVRAPEANFQWLPAPLFGSPLVAEGNTSAVLFAQTGETSTGRFDLHPALHLPLSLSPWLTSATSLAARETAYTSSSQGGGGANRLLFEAGQQLSSHFARRFDEPGLGFQRLTHVVEPSIGYQYVPWVDQDSLPQFSGADFVSGQNRVAYRLASRLLARRETGGEVRNYELASFSVAQSVNLQPQTREFSNLYLEALTPERVDQAVTDVRPLQRSGFSQATERRWSNLVFQTSVSPLPNLSVYGTVAVDVQSPDVAGINSGVVVRLLDAVTLDLGQSYVRNQAIDGIVGKLTWRITRELTLDWLTRYDIADKTFWENTGHLRYTTCCWSATLNVTRVAQSVGVPAQTSVSVLVDLKSPSQTPSR